MFKVNNKDTRTTLLAQMPVNADRELYSEFNKTSLVTPRFLGWDDFFRLSFPNHPLIF